MVEDAPLWFGNCEQVRVEPQEMPCHIYWGDDCLLEKTYKDLLIWTVTQADWKT